MRLIENFEVISWINAPMRSGQPIGKWILFVLDLELGSADRVVLLGDNLEVDRDEEANVEKTDNKGSAMSNVENSKPEVSEEMKDDDGDLGDETLKDVVLLMRNSESGSKERNDGREESEGSELARVELVSSIEEMAVLNNVLQDLVGEGEVGEGIDEGESRVSEENIFDDRSPTA